MRSTSSDFVEEKNKRENSPIYLYTVFLYNGVDNLHFAGAQEDIVFDSITYTKFPIAHSPVGENVNGEIDSVRITLSNVSRQIQSYLEAYEWRSLKVRIRMVFADLLDLPEAKLDDIYYIDKIQDGDGHVVITCTSRFDVLRYRLPGMVYQRGQCRWSLFKGAECGYAGAETSCNRSWQRCIELGNHERFGGFPSIPSQRVLLR